ncbi:hypothetical protein [Yersinia aldovae]|uniref:hypothetical protein n=1 Tax=Yersinia aldovae TaxID=29483 RepID=UPI0005ABBCFE|nr:hypothetical protein [Yersinia aldovae]AJJ64850.1 hypothetical protein AT01_2004 [Yersinia aldovae 670-83]
MRIIDLRCQKLSTNYYDLIMSPSVAKRLLLREYSLCQTPGVTFGPLPGYTLTAGPSSSQSCGGLDPLFQLINSGYIVVVSQNIPWSYRDNPFLIVEDRSLVQIGTSEGFSGKDYIIQKYNAQVAISGIPERSTNTAGQMPQTPQYGPGHWVTIDNNKRGLRNTGIMALNRLFSVGEEGRFFGSDGKDLMHTVQDKIQEWRPIPTGTAYSIASRSVIRKYGEIRKIKQNYLEGDDNWQVEGKSWHWQPVQMDDEYEFQK